MSTLNRRAMVERPGKDLSVRRQCTLLNLARSGVYRPKPVPAADDLALMQPEALVIPATIKIENTQRYREVLWLTRQSAANQSAGRFPTNRENNREFYENRAVWRKIVRKNAAESVSCRAIPYKMKQGINSPRTGNLLSRAGNLLRLTGNCPPCAGISPDLSRLPRPVVETSTRRRRG
jgi:hypothetical protein